MKDGPIWEEQPGRCLATEPALVKRETLPLTSDEKRALSITRRHKREPVRLLAEVALSPKEHGALAPQGARVAELIAENGLRFNDACART